MKAILVLEDGFTLFGDSFTGAFETGGEVIFTTGMTGYQEVLTDPSYCGQLLCMTYPLIGNYGINEEDMESSTIHASALIVKECCKTPSNWRSTMSLPAFLQKHNTAGIEHVDTRALTRHLRLYGSMRGRISTEILDPKKLQQEVLKQPTMVGLNLVQYVACRKPYTWIDNAPHVVEGSYQWRDGIPLVVYDFGIKWNMLRLLTSHGFDVLCVPPNFTVEQLIQTGAKAVFLSNGPGDPATLGSEIAIIREIIAHGFPLTGICLGHQLIAHALGGTTEKLKFGHHGCNHPVKDLETSKVEISSQNHGFVVNLDGVSDVEVTHRNLNDGTIEGLKHNHLPIMSVQYHPEAAAGPHDRRNLFERFKRIINV